ncbi:sulfite reductase subunit alpha [Pseudomonas stutzeri]|nr:sulfite reductase subunit alpha [Stutzerimonas stutzeri]
MPWLETSRAIWAALAVLIWLAVCLRAWRGWRAGRPGAPAHDCLPVAYASQGGQARAIAERSAAQLAQAGLAARAVPLEALDLANPPARLLLVASTYGDGEPPEHAARFARRLEQADLELRDLQYALLGLGDRQYPQFCAFARRLDRTLRARGARPLFDPLQADRLDAAVLRRWQQQLGQLAGHAAFSDWQAADYQPWRLSRRSCLNPGSQGAPLFHLQLTPASGTPDWQAGDIAEIGPRQPAERVAALLAALNLDGSTALADGASLGEALSRRQLPEAPDDLHGLSGAQLVERLPLLAHRDYSIASLPADGDLELLVRQQQHPDGRPGIGSGWLCRHAAPGESIDLRIRANPGFRLPADCGPLILIGNGSGLAGLRAHLRERQQLGQHGHWLLFGERNAAHDCLLREELQGWQRSGHLARLDLVFSRDQATPAYVQHRLRESADELRAWIGRGATLLVCGSLQGMGREVDALLHGLLGSAEVERLREAGRYRRDLY